MLSINIAFLIILLLIAGIIFAGIVFFWWLADEIKIRGRVIKKRYIFW